MDFYFKARKMMSTTPSAYLPHRNQLWNSHYYCRPLEKEKSRALDGGNGDGYVAVACADADTSS